MVPTSKNFLSIQFLRFVAALLVVVFHSTQAISKWLTGNALPGYLHLAGLGEAGVHIFFVISGFVMVYTSFARGHTFSTSQFMLRRIIRIFPIYLLYAGTYILFYWAIGLGKDLSLSQLLGSALLLPGFASLIIGPGWTLSYELYFYIWFAALMTFGMFAGLMALSLVFMGSVALRMAVDVNNDVLHLMTNPLLLEFLMGAWIGFLIVKGRVMGSAAGLTMILVSTLGFLLSVLFDRDGVPRSAAWGVPSALLVLGGITMEIRGSLYSWVKRWSFLGDSSYSLYLLHIMLIDVVILLSFGHGMLDRSWWGASSGTILVISLVATGLCVLTAAICYELLERRIISSLHGLRPFKY